MNQPRASDEEAGGIGYDFAFQISDRCYKQRYHKKRGFYGVQHLSSAAIVKHILNAFLEGGHNHIAKQRIQAA